MIKVCPICGKEFNAKRKEQFLCSIECRCKYKQKKETVICETCGKTFKKFPKEIKKVKHHFCSKECFDKYQKKENIINLKGDYAEILIKSIKYGDIIVKIDNEDIDKIKNFKWCLRKDKDIFYIQSHQFINVNKRKNIQLHRLITNCPENLVVDHINHDTLDNRKINLRVCTIAENNQNRNIN